MVPFGCKSRKKQYEIKYFKLLCLDNSVPLLICDSSYIDPGNISSQDSEIKFLTIHFKKFDQILENKCILNG